MKLIDYLKSCVPTKGASFQPLAKARIEINEVTQFRVTGVLYNGEAGPYPFTCTDNELWSEGEIEYDIHKMTQDLQSKEVCEKAMEDTIKFQDRRMVLMEDLFTKGSNVLRRHGPLALLEFIDNSNYIIIPEDV